MRRDQILRFWSKDTVFRLIRVLGLCAILALLLRGMATAQSYNDDDGGGGGRCWGSHCGCGDDDEDCHHVPEIDLGTTANGVTLLAGGVMLLIERHRGRRR